MFERIVGDAANCARGLIGLDEKLLDSSFMGIFKFKNFKLIISELIQIRLKLENLISQIAYHKDDTYIALRNHLNSLLKFCTCLIKIGENLEMKSYGNSYSVGSYKQDIDELSAAKNDCARTQRLLGNSLPTLSVKQVDELYELVTEEIEQESIIKTLWTKVFSEFNGDTNRAMAEYIKQRMAALRTMAELPYDDDGVWIYYIHDDELYLDSVQCNLFYERGDGTIRTISKGHIVDIPFDQISFPQGSLDYRPTRLDGLIDIVKQKGSYMPLTNRECEDVLLNTLDALRSHRINWDDLRILHYDFETSDLILLTTDDSEVVVKI